MAQPTVRLLGTVRRGRRVLLHTTALQAAVRLVLAVPAAAQPAPSARPQGGTVVAGSAAITRTPTTTTVAQATSRAAVDWMSFNVGSGQTVTFAQPSAAAVTLNRVTGPDPSAIAGQIHANGQIILTNPSGVTFYHGAQVDAQSVVVSAAGMTNGNFMAGRLVFDQAPHPDARVDNRGTITVKQTGLAALVAPSVANSGVIVAKLGQVVLAGATTHTLDLYGDGLVSIDVTGQVRQAPAGADGKPVTALVTNTGTIVADGGVVQLTAGAADGVVQTLVRAGGRIQANTVGARTGRIAVTSIGGDVVVEGRLAADGRAPGTAGGEVVLMASGTTAVAGGAHITASGRAGGGTIALGTTLARARGAGPAPAGTSARTTIAAGARIAADATDTGNGGRVAVLSTQDTDIAGKLSARGGRAGGDGGTVEMSGEQGFALTGTADTSAPHGAAGTILLDPFNLTVVAAGADTVPVSPGTDPNVAAGTNGSADPNDTVTAATISALAGNVHLQAVNNLTIAASINAGSGALNLEAGNNVVVNAGVTVSASGTISLTAASPTIAGFNAAGGVTVNGTLGSAATLTTLTAGTGGVTLGGAVTASTLVINTPGALTQTGGSIVAGTLNGTSSSVSLTSAANKVTNLAGSGSYAVTGTTGDFTLVDSVALGVGQDSSEGGISVKTGRTITLASDQITIQNGVISSTNSGTGQPVYTVLYAPGGTVALTPFTATNGILLTGGETAPANTLVVTTAELPNITAATLQLGAAVGAAGLPSGGIALGSGPETIDLGALGIGKLAVMTAGAVTQGTDPSLDGELAVTTFAGQGASLALGDTNNFLPNLAGFTATTGDILFHAGTVNVTAPLIANGGAGNVTLSSSAATPGVPTMTIGASITGNVVGFDTLATVGGPPDAAGSISQVAGTITANTLNSISYSASLPDANQIAQLGAVTTFAALAVTDAGPLSVAGALTSQAGSVTLNAAGITQTAASSITAAILAGTSSADTVLTNPANAIDSIGAFTQSAGNLSITTASPVLNFGSNSGSISVPTGSLTVVADRVGLLRDTTGGISVPNGVVTFAPLTPSRRIEVIGLTAADPDSLSLSQVFLNHITADSVLQLGNTATTGPINIANAGESVTVPGNAALNLLTTGAVTEGLSVSGQAGGGALGLVALDVSGSAGNISLQAPGNAIQEIGFTVRAPNGSTVGLSGLASAGSITLATSSDLSVAGAITGNVATGAITIGTPGGLTLEPAPAATGVSAGSVTLSAGQALAVAGTLAAPTQLTLAAGTTLTQAGGSITTGLLTGSSGGTATMAGATNAVTSLGTFTSSGGFTLTNAAALAVTGTVTDPTAVTLGAPGITLAGAVNTGTFTANATGAITEAAGGSVTATTLTGAGTAAAFDQPGNAIATLGGFATKAGFSLVDSAPLTVNGPVTDGLSVSITAPVTLTVAGPVTAPTIALTAISGQGPVLGALVQTGATIDGSTSVTLNATGAISQAGGTISTASLTGSSGTTASLPSTSNAVATLSRFTSAGGFTLADGTALTVAGPILDLAAITLGVTGALQLTGTLTTAALTTNATGAITQPGGSVTATTLTGAGTTAAFDQPGNAIATLGGFATKAGFSLVDSAPLTVNGPVTDGTSVSITAPVTLTVAGPVTAPAVALNAISGQDGPVLGALVQTGATIDGSTSVTLNATGAISQTGGTISTASLTGSSGTTASLPSTGNAVATLARFTSAGGFTLADGTALTVAGPISDPAAITLGVTGALQLTGTLTTAALTTNATGAITQPGGSLQLGTGTLAGNAASASFGQTLNTLGRLDAFTTANGFALTDSAPLAVAGAVGTGAGGTIVITNDRPRFVAGGALSAPGGTVQLGPLTAAGLTVGGSDVTTGAFPITATTLEIGAPGGGPVTIAGALTLSGVAVVDLESGGAIGETGAGAIGVGTLVGNGATAALNGANGVGTLGRFTTRGAFTLTNAAALAVTGPLAGSAVTLDVTGNVASPGGLSVTGPVTAGALTLAAAGPITLGGNVTGSTVSLLAAGSITQTGGTLTAGTLTGSAAGTASLGATTIGTLGPFSVTGATGTLSLTDSAALTVTGPLSAANIGITATGQLTVAGGTITTNGLPVAQQVGGADTSPGSFLAVTPNAAGRSAFVQTGTTTVTPLFGSTNTVRIDPQAVFLNDLVAPNTNVILGLGAGGTASGTLTAASLLVLGSGGSVTLSGSVAGQVAFNAAYVSQISPAFDVNYLLNGCAIASATCGPAAPPPKVAAIPDQNFILPQSFLRPGILSLDVLSLSVTPDQDDPTLLLPNISDRDY